MNPSPFAHCERAHIAKRTLSPLRRACLSLGLRVDARPRTDMARVLRKTGLGNTAIHYLRFSSDEDARRIVALYDTLNPTERKAVTIDYLLMATGVDVHHMWGVIQEERSRIGGMEAQLLACMNGPDLVSAAIQRALTPEGHKDRHLVLWLAGFVPTPP